MDYSALFANWSKLYRDLYTKGHNSFVEEWVKAEQKLAEPVKAFAWWKN